MGNSCKKYYNISDVLSLYELSTNSYGEKLFPSNDTNNLKFHIIKTIDCIIHDIAINLHNNNPHYKYISIGWMVTNKILCNLSFIPMKNGDVCKISNVDIQKSPIILDTIYKLQHHIMFKESAYNEIYEMSLNKYNTIYLYYEFV